jgi:hypothetical protein
MAQKTASQTRTEAKRGVDETNERSLFFFVCLSGVAVLTRLLFLFATAASPVSRHSLTSAVQSSPAPLPFPNENGLLYFSTKQTNKTKPRFLLFESRCCFVNAFCYCFFTCSDGRPNFQHETTIRWFVGGELVGVLQFVW